MYEAARLAARLAAREPAPRMQRVARHSKETTMAAALEAPEEGAPLENAARVLTVSGHAPVPRGWRPAGASRASRASREPRGWRQRR